MALLAHGDHVWVGGNVNFDVPIGACVQSVDGSMVVLKDDKGQLIQIERSIAESLSRVHPGSIQDVQDMIQLGDLSEAAILRNLLLRYQNEKIYTYIGTVLVAVNPYKFFPVYDSTFIDKYRDNDLKTLPPHIFATAEHAYSLMTREQHNQCVIISGESGSGKTESTKFILQYLAAVSGQHSKIEQQILDANPILEAFGNAKTLRNDNSSRFGKYIDVHFNKNAVIEGAKIDQYLLEKSRIVNQMPDERNYHIFYRMLAGMTSQDLKSLHLTTAEDYYYLSQGNCFTCQSLDDARDFQVFRQAMKVLSFKEKETWRLFKIMAAILHLGNISFRGTVHENMEASEVMDPRSLKYASELLEVPTDSMEKAFTMKSTYASGEVIYSTISETKATDVRDAFVKGIYGKLFIWIVSKINAVIFKRRTKETENVPRTAIGVLDIFGFEVFDVNSFEQLCINYANENLQQFFVAQIFKMEQEEYSREGIEWNHVDYQDNQEVLDMLAGKPMNFIVIMDEESRFPQGSDETFLHKINTNHGENASFVKSTSLERTKFGVVHYAGTVFYESEGMLDKNRDTFSGDLIDLIAQSDSNFLLDMFTTERKMGTETRKRNPTLSIQFRRSLNVLMKTLSNCHSSFVRCIKPNHYKHSMEFDRRLCWQQLKYSGMLETVRVRKSGYSMRHTFQEFVTRYHMLVHDSHAKSRDPRQISEIIASTLLGSSGWVLGTKRIFMKESQDSILEKARERLLTSKVVLLQRAVRKYFQQKRERRLKNGAVLIQKTWRGFQQRRAYKKMRHGFCRLQAVVRSRMAVKRYENLKLLKKEQERRRRDEEKKRENERKRKEEEDRKREEKERIRKEEERKKQEEERRRQEEEERRRYEQKQWLKQQEIRKIERQRKQELERKTKEAEAQKRQQSILDAIKADGKISQEQASSSSMPQSLPGRYGSRGLTTPLFVGGSQATLQSTISDLTSVLRPSSGSNATAFAVSLLTFGVALGTTYGQQQQQPIATETTLTTSDKSPKQSTSGATFVSPLRTTPRGPQASNRNGST